MRLLHCGLAATLFTTAILTARAGDSASLCADRAALERVYHLHRLVTQQTFEAAMPQAVIQQLVELDQRKEAALRQAYGVEITPAMIAAEVQRMDSTTRAPDVLAEIKHALGDDAARFARAMARPVVVERELRRRFDSDDRLHTAPRAAAEQVRADLIAGKPVKDMHDVTWQLTPGLARHSNAESGVPGIGDSTLESRATSPTQASTKSSAYTNEATAQVAQPLASPDHTKPGSEKLYFDDLDPDLKRVLRAQLKKPGDVSAVIEAPGGFLVFLAKARTAETLSAASVSIPKRSYEEWLTQQPKP